MDLLFKRYASPFLLLDNYIRTGRFNEYVTKFTDLQNEEDLWQYYLHKPIEKSYEEFKKAVKGYHQSSKEDIKITIATSKNTLDAFIPEGRGEEYGTV